MILTKLSRFCHKNMNFFNPWPLKSNKKIRDTRKLIKTLKTITKNKSSLKMIWSSN